MGEFNQAKQTRYLNALRQAGRRITAQRELVCSYLATTDSHPTPYQAYAELSTQHPEISRATVYNTLNVLRELGAIVVIGFGADHTRYDTDTSPHVNLICLRCHEISDADGPLPWQGLQEEIEATGGFRPVAVRVDVLGFCARCREQKKSEIRAQWLAQRNRHD